MRRKNFEKLQLFAFDSNDYCDFTSSVAKAIAGKDILLCVWNIEGTELLAISGQQGLTINRSADQIEITSKDTQGGWKSYLAGACAPVLCGRAKRPLSEVLPKTALRAPMRRAANNAVHQLYVVRGGFCCIRMKNVLNTAIYTKKHRGWCEKPPTPVCVFLSINYCRVSP